MSDLDFIVDLADTLNSPDIFFYRMAGLEACRRAGEGYLSLLDLYLQVVSFEREETIER